VVSGGFNEEARGFDEESPEESFSFDEHLLERISVLEEAVKRTAETVRHLLTALDKQERNILINQSGLTTLRELLEGKRVLDQDEWSELWEARMNYQLLTLEKRERFVDVKERIGALYKGDQRPAFMSLLEEAEYALFAFDLERAREALENAYELDDANYELAYFVGETYFNDGQAERALPFFERLLEVVPDHYDAVVYSGVIHHERGETERAEELLCRAVQLEPDSFLANFSLGAVYADQGHLDRAVALLHRAVEIDAVPQARFMLGNCLYEMGKLTPAIRNLELVVRHDPAYEEAHYVLGMAYLDRRWNRKALEAFRQAEQLNPRKMRYQDLVRYLSGQDRAPLPEVGEEAGRWLDRAERHLSRENPRRAVSCYQRAIRIDPDNPLLLMSFAMACLQLNRCRESEAMARRVIDLKPGEMLTATACATLIEALRTEGRYREGNRVGKRLLEQGESSFAKTIAYYEIAYNLAEMGESLDQALDYARRAVDLAPEELKQFPLAAVGWVHYKREEFDEAVEFLSRSSELGPSETNLTKLGMALLASGEDERARGIFARAREIGGRGSLEQRMMECLHDSSRLLQRVRQGRG
jgi:tetratricopeptide (TPR) repeat protein